MNKTQIFRGAVWFADLEPVEGHEQGSKRPCLIISDDLFNNSPAELVAILPITKKYRPLVWYIAVEPPEGGLKIPSYIISNQIRVISINRLSGKNLGFISSKTMLQVEERLRLLLNL
jgi:mRNA interferase MazF